MVRLNGFEPLDRVDSEAPFSKFKILYLINWRNYYKLYEKIELYLSFSKIYLIQFYIIIPNTIHIFKVILKKYQTNCIKVLC